MKIYKIWFDANNSKDFYNCRYVGNEAKTLKEAKKIAREMIKYYFRKKCDSKNCDSIFYLGDGGSVIIERFKVGEDSIEEFEKVETWDIIVIKVNDKVLMKKKLLKE